MNCPSCNSLVDELISCDLCSGIGCIRCVTRSNKQWLCKKCKSEEKIIQPSGNTAESALAAMFG